MGPAHQPRIDEDVNTSQMCFNLIFANSFDVVIIATVPDQSLALQNWDPMADDYLSKRNVYKVDDEDAGVALEGYSENLFLPFSP